MMTYTLPRRLRRFIKAVLPYGVVALSRRYRHRSPEPAAPKSINIRFIGEVSDKAVLDTMRQEGSYIHFGQSGEEAILNRIFAGKRNGFYVDIGAFHPTQISNTFLLHNFFGWSGINIDASKQAIEAFKISRPDDINLNVAIGAKEGAQKLTVYSDPARNTFSNKNRERQKKKGDTVIVGTEMVSVKPLKKVLDEYLPRGKHIDVLDIDIEGYDLEALKTNDWNKYRPSVILIEDYAINTKGFKDSDVYKFMKTVDYRFFSHAFDTSIYVDNQQSFNI